MEVFKLNLRDAGMFSNLNEVVQQVYLAEKGGYAFHINWAKSCYSDPARPGDPWSYYFDPCFPEAPPLTTESRALLGGPPIACAKDNIITPRLVDGRCDPLLLPRDRLLPHEIIRRRVHMKAHVYEAADIFAKRVFDRSFVGLHIRGAGRTDGGVPQRNKTLDLVDGVPLSIYFAAADEALDQRPDSLLLVCSDSSIVIGHVVARYGKRVVVTDATRSAFGEMHASHPNNNGEIFDPYKLGMDVLIDALLLSRSDFLVHGNSNVTNFILCFRPEIKNHYVYEY